MSYSSPRTRLGVVSGAALLGAALLTGCGSINALVGGANDDDSGDDGATVFDLATGDCLNEPEAADGDVYDVEIVPCDEPHDYELYHEYSLDLGDEWPGADGIKEDAQKTCAEEFESFVGLPLSRSDALWYSYYSPTETSWEQGDDTIQCLVYEASDDQGASIVKVEGTLEGSKR